MPACAAPENLKSCLDRLSFVGRETGLVKLLPAFDKSRHTVPDAVNAATAGFLARLCAGPLAEEGERWFQRARAGFGYKRAQLSLDVSVPVAVLAARDFSLELGYTLRDAAPAEYEITRTLGGLRDGDAVSRAEMDELFAGTFEEIVFTLKRGVRVEAVIDAVEALDNRNGEIADETEETDAAELRVDYPSDCAHCVLTVSGVEAAVVCDGASLAMRFPRKGSPRELAEGFVAVRRAFALTRERVLAGLL